MGEDLKVLLNLNSVRAFQKAAELFIIKWISTHSEIVTYLNVNWFSKNFTWFKGYSIWEPSNNNNFLNFTRELDDTSSKAKLPSLKEVITNCFAIVSNWALWFECKDGRFQKVVTIYMKANTTMHTIGQ